MLWREVTRIGDTEHRYANDHGQVCTWEEAVKLDPLLAVEDSDNRLRLWATDTPRPAEPPAS